MKNKIKELAVDFIGDQDTPITNEEQNTISTFITQLKEKQIKNTKIKLGKMQSKKCKNLN